MAGIELSSQAKGSGSGLRGASVDLGIVGVMRLTIALAAMVISAVPVFQGSTPHDALVLACEFVYAAWSLGWMLQAAHRRTVEPWPYHYWIDVAFAASMVALSGGDSGTWLFVFLFASLVASFTRGFAEGLRVTVVSFLLLQLVLLWVTLQTGVFDFDRSVVRPFLLLVLGSTTAYWGGHELATKRRLHLLQEISNQWNPRFGHDHAIGVNLELALDFFAGSACVLVLRRPTSPPIHLTYHSSNRKRGLAMLPSQITDETAGVLLRFPAQFAGRHGPPPRWWSRWLPGGAAANDAAVAEHCVVLANLLDTDSFITVPYAQRDGSDGRVFLTPGKRPLGSADVVFLQQLMTTIANVVEGMQLMDELVSRAAEHERYRISLDIHDTTIQPYIGLKLGLDALAREAGDDNALSPRIAELQGMTESTVRYLRRYVSTLQDDKHLAGDSLVAAVRDQASHYQRFYALAVDIRCDGEVQVNSQIAGALLQIVAEGLSNILRHSTARQAYIGLFHQDNRIVVEIGNEASADLPWVPFIPKSIAARSRSMGGTSVVSQDALGYTMVRIMIPL